MTSRILYLSLFSCCAAFAWQAPPPQPAAPLAFEVASIKPPEPMPMGMMRIMMNVDGSMLRYGNVSLKDCIRVAYRVKEFQVQGPDWLGSTRFDIVAKLPAGAKEDQVPELLQALLADRFHLKVHRETKEHSMYALVVAKGGPKLKPAKDDDAGAPQSAGTPQLDAGPGGPPPPPPPPPPGGMSRDNPSRGVMPRGEMMMRMSPGGAHLTATGVTLALLAGSISQFTERPVVDLTGIKGKYDFDLVFAPEMMHFMSKDRGAPMPPPGAGPMPRPGASEAQRSGGGETMRPDGAERPLPDAPIAPAGSIQDAVRAYGLKLESRKGPMEIITVDHIDKAPTEN